MIVSNYTALFDACVLYPAPLRDVLMHLVQTGLFRAKWTEAIHEERIGSLLKNRPDLTRSQLEWTRLQMNTHAEGCLVTNYEDLIPSLQLPDQFLTHLLDLAPNVVCAAAKRQRQSLKKPPKTVAEFLETLEATGHAQTVARLREFAELL